MSRTPNYRREIAPLDVPWLQHDQFPATKQACSSDDGLTTASKNSVVKVVQELKRGRAHVDKQLAQLDSQLLAITDYLDGKSSSMFPSHLVMYVEENPDVVVAPAHGASSASDGRRHVVDGATRNVGAAAGKAGGVYSSDLPPPTTAMVEDDLASETPCTTIGLWKYLYAYSYFKTITPEDMKQALQLEDPNTLFGEDRRDGKDVAGFHFDGLEDKFSLSKSSPQDLDDIFKERLVASLCPEVSSSSHKEKQSQSDDQNHCKQEPTADLARSVELGSWNPKGVKRVLRDVGLVKASDKEFAQRSLSNPRDDEVSQEIRLLQRQLRACIERTNESKRKIRKKMDETKPWLSKKKEEDEATIQRYFTMWQTKKELARKRKLREKRLQRQQALRLGGGGGSGKPLADDVDIKRR